MNEKEFRKKSKKFCKMVAKRGISFFGLGCFPTDKYGRFDKEVGSLFQDLLEYEPFLKYVREELGVDDE